MGKHFGLKIYSLAFKGIFFEFEIYSLAFEGIYSDIKGNKRTLSPLYTKK